MIKLKKNQVVLKGKCPSNLSKEECYFLINKRLKNIVDQYSLQLKNGDKFIFENINLENDILIPTTIIPSRKTKKEISNQIEKISQQVKEIEQIQPEAITKSEAQELPPLPFEQTTEENLPIIFPFPLPPIVEQEQLQSPNRGNLLREIEQGKKLKETTRFDNQKNFSNENDKLWEQGKNEQILLNINNQCALTEDPFFDLTKNNDEENFCVKQCPENTESTADNFCLPSFKYQQSDFSSLADYMRDKIENNRILKISQRMLCPPLFPGSADTKEQIARDDLKQLDLEFASCSKPINERNFAPIREFQKRETKEENPFLATPARKLVEKSQKLAPPEQISTSFSEINLPYQE